MFLSRPTRVALRCFTALVLLVLYFPLAYVARLSFATSRGFAWPPSGFTLDSWNRALDAEAPRTALGHSITIAFAAMVIALVLGSAAASALTRFRFFGRNAINLLIVLPIALPGIVTGIAFNAAFDRRGIELSRFTLIVAHATFCIVIVFNNMTARMRQLPSNLDEASADLGARPFQTFRFVRLPLLTTALLAGGLLAFALSFDEIIVTTFTADSGYQTLPIWIFQNMFRDRSLPIVNVVATFVVIVMIVPVYVAQRLVDTRTASA